MPNEQDLSVLRAAVQFWHEEMSPHGNSGLEAYFDVPTTGLDVVGVAGQLRQRLHCCELRYAICNKRATRFLQTKVFQSQTDVRAAVTESASIATLLLTGIT